MLLFFDSVPKWFVGDGVERLREVDCRCPHFDTPLVTFLLSHPVRCKVVCCLVGFSEASVIFRSFLVERWVESSVQNHREQFVQRRQ